MDKYIDINVDITKKLVDRKKFKQKGIIERYNKQFDFVKKYIKKNFKILDIGCRTGGYLKKLSENGYKNLFGIDVSQYALKLCREKFDCCEMDLMNMGFPDKTFDYVHMSHVLEHVPNPIVALKNVSEALKENGLLFIEVPLQKRKIFEKRNNGHFYFFEEESDLTELLENYDILKQEFTRNGRKKRNFRLLCKKIIKENKNG